jgi:hypothetical protein
VPPEVYRAFGFPGADDLGNMFQFKRDFNDEFCVARDPATACYRRRRTAVICRGVEPELGAVVLRHGVGLLRSPARH